MHVTIIGAGNMGRGIGHRIVAGGHSVTIVDRDAEEAQQLMGNCAVRPREARRSQRQNPVPSCAARWWSSPCTIQGTSRSPGI